MEVTEKEQTIKLQKNYIKMLHAFQEKCRETMLTYLTEKGKHLQKYQCTAITNEVKIISICKFYELQIQINITEKEI